MPPRHTRANLSAKRDAQGRIDDNVQYRTYTDRAKVGATSGWVVAAATDVGRCATCPQSQTASTLVLPISGLKVGSKIKGFHGVGQIESGGGTVTFDIQLRKLTSAAADLTDAQVAAATQLSVTADTIISRTNTGKTLSTAETVAENTTYYILITVTTGASCDIDLMGAALHVDESDVS